MTYKITLQIDCDTQEQCAAIAHKLQTTAQKVDSKTLLKMFTVLEKNPKWINMASNAVKFM